MNLIRVGDVTIAAIVEHQKLSRTPWDFFVGCYREVARAHMAGLPDFVYERTSERMVFTFQSFLVRTPRNVILVDTCVGEDKFGIGWNGQPWLDGLHALGLTVEDIDYVLCTHLHIDHTGWNTRLEKGRWVPTFPKARYLFERDEYAYWQQVAESGEVPQGQRDGVWQLNCLPIVEAGQAQLVSGAHRIDENVSLIPTPGHSPGHYCVRIHSRGQEAVALGDLMHHMLQCCEPDWSTTVCWDAGKAAKARRTLLAEAAQNGTILMPHHFPSPTAGRVTAEGERFNYRFV